MRRSLGPVPPSRSFVPAIRLAHASLLYPHALLLLRRLGNRADPFERLDRRTLARVPRAADRTPQGFVNSFTREPEAPIQWLHENTT